MRRLILGAALAAFASFPAGTAHAEIPQSLLDSCRIQTAAPGQEYRFCDDGIPSAGGREPNADGARAVRVPGAYAGYRGLPAKDPAKAAAEGGADANGDVALDVNVSLPAGDPPPNGWPLLVMMHGCCAGSKTGWEAQDVPEGERFEGAFGEQWHYNNAWFAARGYVVLTYTSRGFINDDDRGSTGETRLQARSFEMNDMQHLAGQLADNPFFSIDPSRVVVTGGSYGGGFSWMALTDPLWQSPGGRDMRLAAVAPKYGWTDVIYTLLPNGRQSVSPARLPAFDGSDSSSPLGMPKQSITAGLYASGTTGVPPGSSHATFAPFIDNAILCLNGPYPLESSPLCERAISEALPFFLAESSAYYQDEFFAAAARDPRYRVPVFNSATLTDPLFPPIENHRMVNRMLATAPDWPVQQHFGDVQHFVPNKTKEWTDVCAANGARRTCELGDYPGGDVESTPPGLVRTGTTTRINRFIDHFARPAGNADEPRPSFDVTVAPQVCNQQGSGDRPGDEPGTRIVAPRYSDLATETLRFGFNEPPKTISSPVLLNLHAIRADPVANDVTNQKICPLGAGPAGTGVATYETPPLGESTTMVGPATVRASYRTQSGPGIQLNVRMYDVFPDGRRVMVDRGPSRWPAGTGTASFELYGTVHTFAANHRIALEVTQDDAPFVRSFTAPASAVLERVELDVPAQPYPPALPSLSLRADPVATALDPAGRAAFSWSPRAGAAPVSFELQRRSLGRRAGSWRPLGGRIRSQAVRLATSPGRTYSARVRATDELERAGPWRSATFVVPASELTRGARYRGPWQRLRSARALHGRLVSCAGRGCSLELRYSGRDFALVAPRTPAGGRAVLTIDGRSRTVSFRSRSRRDRVVIARRRLGPGVHRVRLRALGRGRVYVDGLAMARRR